MEHMENQAETKKMNTGKIGFILSILVLPALFFTVFFCLLGPVTFVLFTISLFYCIHGLIKKRSRKLAITGLLINIITIALLSLLFIEFTPPGSIPYPLNIYKFKKVCPPATFWLDFDNANLIEVESGIAFLSPYASLDFQRNSGKYSKDKIIEFAEENGWKCHLSIPITQKNLYIFDRNNQDLSTEEMEFQAHIFSCNPIPLLFHDGDTLLVFKTTHYLEYPSFVLLSKNSDELKVYYEYPVLPGSGEDRLPDLFYTLSEKYNKDDQ